MDMPKMREVLAELDKLALERKELADKFWLSEHRSQELREELGKLLDEEAQTSD